MAGVSNKRDINGRKTPSNHSREHKRCKEMNYINQTFYISCFGVHRKENNVIFYEGYVSITLNKLRSAFSNHNKFNGSCRAVSSLKIQ